MLAKWGLMRSDEPPAQIEAKLGIKITKVEIQHDDPTDGLFEFVLGHRPDLMVLATHGREGLNRWLRGSVSEEVARRTHVPTLFIGPRSQRFVDTATGQMRLQRILIPVAHSPSPLRSFVNPSGKLAGAAWCFAWRVVFPSHRGPPAKSCCLRGNDGPVARLS